jgi:hypothetical protein
VFFSSKQGFLSCREAGLPGQRCDKPDSHGGGGTLLVSKLFNLHVVKRTFWKMPKVSCCRLISLFLLSSAETATNAPPFLFSVFLVSVKQAHTRLYTLQTRSFSFLGIFVSNFWYSMFALLQCTLWQGGRGSKSYDRNKVWFSSLCLLRVSVREIRVKL